MCFAQCFQGFRVSPRDGLAFGADATHGTLEIRNDGATAATVTVRMTPESARVATDIDPVPPGLFVRDALAAVSNDPWTVFTTETTLNREISPGETWKIAFALDISQLVAASYTDKGLARIDRGTVDELDDICESAAAIVRALDRVDAGLNPLGLSDHAIPFDIAPGGVADGTQTHYEQVRDRAKTALSNARKMLERAQTQGTRMRLIEEAGSGDGFKAKIVSTRSLGAFDADGEPVVGDKGDLGLSGYLAQMDANWQVLKPRLGINNPQDYTTWFSLRKELFRILEGEAGDVAWAKELDKHWTDDILSNAEFRRHCQPFQSKFGLKAKEPGLIIPFETTIDFAKNLFGHDLAGGDHAYDSTWYSTRIAAAGVWFDGYNAKTADAASSAQAQLAADPVVYLVPVGFDYLRTPGLADGTCWRFSVVDQVIAAPYDIGSYELDGDTWMPSLNDADWQGVDATVKIRRHPSFRAYFDPNGGEPTDDRLDATRLVGRSVWNSRWLLVIPVGAMNADREKALMVFVNGSDTNRDGKLDLKPVSDIKIGFRTYSQSGN